MADPTRYRIDSSRGTLVDTRTHKTVCDRYEITGFFRRRTNATKREFERIDDLMARLVDEKTRLQAQCRHKNATHEYHADTGNYDPSCDSHWIECHCHDCGRTWTEDQ